MEEEKDKNAQFYLPLDQPVVSLEVIPAFEGLSDKEKLYAHHVGEASWTGGLIALLQTSPESGPIFVLLHKFFSAEDMEEFVPRALKSDFFEDELKSFFVYSCGVFGNNGNYKCFGDSKFIPAIDVDRVEELLKLSPIWHSLEALWEQVKRPMYDVRPEKTCLGYAPHVTTYLSRNCTPKDTENVQNWMKSHQMEAWNSRLFKTEADGKIDYEIRLASQEQGELKCETIENITYRVTCGDYSPLMAKVVQSLEKARKYTANETEEKMLESYIKSFVTGSVDDHKEGSRIWIQDKSPPVESYIGFIENYRDPAGVRGEFEGFVAVVNREMSKKFSQLVDQAENFLTLLPWPKGFEKDKFLRPDFTSLDVLTFAGSTLPAGINIPNYEEIRQTEGFKNVSLGNVIPASCKMTRIPFLGEQDAFLLQKWKNASFEVQVGLHELLGHGSGKLFQENADGTKNFSPSLMDPLTDKPPTSWYEPGDTFDSKFGALSSAYEECRAEAVGLYLSLEPKVLEIFGHKEQVAADITYVNWLAMVWNGLGVALETYEPGRGWLQAHSMARFVIARVLMEAKIVKVVQTSDADLLITLDRNAIKDAGKKAIGQFLVQLQVYKTTADVAGGTKFFNHYADVQEPWLSWRKIVLAQKLPRKLFILPNTALDEENVILKTYPESVAGMVQSWVDRFPDPEPLYKAILDLATADAHHFV